MDIQKLKELKKEANLTNKEISDLSGIPLSTINKIFSGATENPRYSTLLAIEEVLNTKSKIPFSYNPSNEETFVVKEDAVPYQFHARTYHEKDIERLSEGTLAELIKQKLYMLAAPCRIHQLIISNIIFQISWHIHTNNGKCHVYPAPFDVRLFGDNTTIVQPDISVICRPEILTDRGCDGAPDWIIEVASKSNSPHDYVTKLMQYQKAGVREYWIVDPAEQMIHVYNFENPSKTDSYQITVAVPSGIFDGLTVKLTCL